MDSIAKMQTTGGKNYRKKNSNRKGSRKGSRKGGNCQSTGSIGTSVYGAGNEQHAQEGNGNVIAFKGGNGEKYAGNGLTDIAVPAALLYANHRYSRGKVAYGRRSTYSKKRFGKSKRRTNRRYRRR